MSVNIHSVKDLVLQPVLCVLPWHGFTLFPNGDVKNCAVSEENLGNIHKQFLPDILNNDVSEQVRSDMKSGIRHDRCTSCYRSEDLQPGLNPFSKISNRIWYMKIMRNHDLDVYKSTKYVASRVLDLRWRNTCNFACIYCGPDLSSRWAAELNDRSHIIDEQVFKKNKEYILQNLHGVKHVYLAGGEPLLIAENLELLERLREQSPEATVRVNTNLSKINNKIFDMLCHDFKNTKWTISIDSIEDSFEYIRYPGVWSEFQKNLKILQGKTNNIDFNMTWSILNAYDIFDAVDLLQCKFGFRDSTFVIQPIFSPEWLFIQNLSNSILIDIEKEIKKRLAQANSEIYRNSLRSMLTCLSMSWEKQSNLMKYQIDVINQRRNIVSPKSLHYLLNHCN